MGTFPKAVVHLFPVSIRNTVKKTYLQSRYDVDIKAGCIVNLADQFEGHNVINCGTEFTNSFLGLGSYIACHSVIRLTRIGRFCAIGDHVRTGLGIHPTEGFASIHPAFFSKKKQAGFSFVEKDLFEEHAYIKPDRKYVVEIGHDVWVGNNVIILDGIRVGHGAILAAGAVVTKNVDPYCIVGGIPARIIRKRFPDDTIERMLEIRWWDWDISQIQTHADLFSNVDQLVKAHQEGHLPSQAL